MVKRPFGFERPEESPGFLLWQTTVVWQRQIKKTLESYGVSHAQFVIMALTLWYEQQDRVPTQIMIAAASNLDKMTVSKALKELVARNLIERQEYSEDSRAKALAVTAQGKELLHTLVPRVERVDELYFSSLSVEEKRVFIKVMKKLVRGQ